MKTTTVHPLSANHEAIIEKVKTFPGKKVKVGISDIDGILRGKMIHLDKFLSSVSGRFGFCDVVFGWDSHDKCYDNTDYTGWHTGYPDTQACIDLNTYRCIPWEDNTPFFLVDLEHYDGTTLPITPRNLLKQIRQEAIDLGYVPIFAAEFEWFNFRETSEELHEKNFQNPRPITQGMFGYSLLRSSQNSPFFNELFDALAAFNVPLEGLHTETGPGVYEAAIMCDDVLEAADRATLFKHAAKEIGHRHGIMPTFMAKWNMEYPGCSEHLHQSLWDIEKDENSFYSPDGPGALMKHYIAGQLHCLPYILPMYAPTINSYKRLVEGHWAPTTLTWGIDNRTVAVRALLTGEKSSRLELRVAGADANPYLAMAASLASGLYGIKHKIPLDTPPLSGSGYEETRYGRLPTTLKEATDLMKHSTIAGELFGKAFVKHFLQTREWEWRQHLESVTDWEFKRYFEII